MKLYFKERITIFDVAWCNKLERFAKYSHNRRSVGMSLQLQGLCQVKMVKKDHYGMPNSSLLLFILQLPKTPVGPCYWTYVKFTIIFDFSPYFSR